MNLQLLFKTLRTMKNIIFEHASRVKYTEFLHARCLPSSENLNGSLVLVLCTFIVCTSKESSCSLLGGRKERNCINQQKSQAVPDELLDNPNS